MPLKLVPPGKIKGAASYYIRGTHLGVRVFRSARTDRPALAARELRHIQQEIEQGRYAERAAPAAASFADAALGYLKDCPQGEVAKVQRLLDHFRTDPLTDFNKDKIDEGEAHFYPGRRTNYAAGTLNREYRSPVAAVLHHAAGRSLCPWIKVEKYTERQTTKWLEPDKAVALFAAAAVLDAAKREGNLARLAPLLIFLFSTGCRISEACHITWPDIDLERREVRLHNTKNGESYTVHLGELAFEAVANLPGPRVARRKIFGYASRHSVKTALFNACKAAGMVVVGDDEKERKTFNLHQARHSFATWLRRQQGMDMKKLMDLGRWRDVKSVARYAHVSADEHAPAIAALPINRQKA
jgi:integrase